MTSPKDPGGYYIIDPLTGKEEFISWQEIHEVCAEVMALPEFVAESELGKPNFRNDPTYNLSRKGNTTRR